MRWATLCVLFASATLAQEDFPHLPSNVRDRLRRGYMSVRRTTQNALGKTSELKRTLKAAEKLRMLQVGVPERFPCDVSFGRSPEVPDSVDRVRPGDLDVVGALGDSLTVALGAAASNLIRVLVENRGISWSAGGQETWKKFLTLPNILKEFNPSLIGYSLGDSLSFESGSQFNVAEAGAMSHDMPFMAKELVARLTKDPRVDLKNHWKLVTLFIGGNDYCSDMCYTDPAKYLRTRRENLMKTLDYLLENLPRTIVNFVVSPNVKSGLPKILTTRCWITQTMECPCVMGSRFAPKVKEYEKFIKQAQREEIKIAKMNKYRKKDFVVISQPFTFNAQVPYDKVTQDASYLSFDCFHFSQKGHAKAANALWNNMMEPVGNKSTNWDKEFEVFKCPTQERPFIYTYGNSA